MHHRIGSFGSAVDNCGPNTDYQCRYFVVVVFCLFVCLFVCLFFSSKEPFDRHQVFNFKFIKPDRNWFLIN